MSLGQGFAESRIRRLIEKLCYVREYSGKKCRISTCKKPSKHITQVNHRSKYMLGNIHLWPKAFMVDPEPTPTPEKDDDGDDRGSYYLS